MYTQVRARVKNCGSFLDFFECSVGLKQGEVLSPILFSLFLEDLDLYLLDNINSGITIEELSFILLFADDRVIMGDTPNDLQNSLDLLSAY